MKEGVVRVLAIIGLFSLINQLIPHIVTTLFIIVAIIVAYWAWGAFKTEH